MQEYTLTNFLKKFLGFFVLIIEQKDMWINLK